MRKSSLVLLFMCIIIGLCFHNVSQHWKIVNYSEIITHIAKNLEYTRHKLDDAHEKLLYYSSEVDNLTKKLEYTINRLNKADNRIFALGRNLAHNKHSYDFKFTIMHNETEFDFFAHKYILCANSEYFEQLFANNSIYNITYYDITESEFNSFMELLYFGQFESDVELENYENIIRYVNKYLVFEKYKSYIESYFSEMINYNIEIDNMELVAHIYNISNNTLNNVQNKILASIYNKWKCTKNGEYLSIINYPTILYDYINFINCGKNNVKMLSD